MIRQAGLCCRRAHRQQRIQARGPQTAGDPHINRFFGCGVHARISSALVNISNTP
jgi:hypothetical protein